MKNLIIVGAGDMARDILQLAKEVNASKPVWNIRGFIADEGLNIKDLTNGEFDIVGSIEKWQPEDNEVFVCAIANPIRRERVVKQLKERGAEFVKLIHPTVWINDYCIIGEGAIIYPYATIGANAKLGNYVILHSTVIGHDVTVGDFTNVNGFCGILGRVRLGDRVFVGYNATIIMGKVIGDDAYIGAGSVVVRNVAEGTKVFGNPARKLDL